MWRSALLDQGLRAVTTFTKSCPYMHWTQSKPGNWSSGDTFSFWLFQSPGQESGGNVLITSVCTSQSSHFEMSICISVWFYKGNSNLVPPGPTSCWAHCRKIMRMIPIRNLFLRECFPVKGFICVCCDLTVSFTVSLCCYFTSGIFLSMADWRFLNGKEWERRDTPPEHSKCHFSNSVWNVHYHNDSLDEFWTYLFLAEKK